LTLGGGRREKKGWGDERKGRGLCWGRGQKGGSEKKKGTSERTLTLSKRMQGWKKEGGRTLNSG